MGLSAGIVHLVGAGPQCRKNLPFHAWTQADALPVPLAMLMSPDSCQGLISLGTGPDAALAGAWLCLTLPGHISTTDQLGCSQRSGSVQNPGQSLLGNPFCPSAAHWPCHPWKQPPQEMKKRKCSATGREVQRRVCAAFLCVPFPVLHMLLLCPLQQ